MNGITGFINDNAMLLMGVLVFGGLIFIITRMFKEAARRKINIGQVLNEHFVSEHETWIMFTVIGLWITESLIAASIHPIVNGVEEQQINAVARFFSHFITALVGIVMVTFMPKVIISLVESFGIVLSSKGNKKRMGLGIVYIITYFGLFLIVGYATVRIPLFNIELIAAGLGNLDQLNYAWWELFGKDVDYQRLGLPENYDPVRAMSFQMFASWIILLCHYLISLIDAIIVLIKLIEKEINLPSNINQTINDRGNLSTPSKEDIEDILDDPLKVIKFILKRVTTHSAQKIDELADEYKLIFIELTHIPEAKRVQVQNKISNELAKLYTQWKNINEITKNMTSSRKKSQIDTLKNKCFQLFADANEGFNRPLSNSARS